MSTFVGIPRIPSKRRIRVDADQARIIRMACSLLLDYPDEALESEIAAVRAELHALPDEVAEELKAFCTQAEQMGLRALQVLYVETFDQRRRCALSLTYYSQGDTRGRGQAILAFKEVMARAGFEPAREELPDHLPVVLEFCALDESGVGEDLLGANREGIEVLRTALRSADSPYAHLLNALVLTLPEPSPEAIEGYRKLISQGPPTELVGIGDLTATPFPMSQERLQP